MSMGPTLDISFKGVLHRRILDAVRRRHELSRRRFSDRHEAWRKSEETALAYLNLGDKDLKRKSARENDGSPQYVTIDIPYSYAQLLAAHTYWTSVFLGRSPIFQFSGRHGETEDAVQAVEALVDYQLLVGNNLVPLYIWLFDVGKYGIGVLGDYWDREEVVTTQIIEGPKIFMGVEIPGTKQKTRQSQRMLGYLGNRFYNVRPYDFFPDPRVPLTLFKTGEFCGRRVEVGWNTILRREAAGQYTNVEALRRTRPGQSLREDGSSQLILPNTTNEGGTEYLTQGSQAGVEDRLDHVELLEMYIDLVPSDWGLGSSKYPEKWVFVVGNDSVVLHAGPLGCQHNSFPFDVLEFEIEGYGLFKRSALEIQKPLNDTLTWLFNSHFHNVRKVLNDQLVVDPSRVVMKDLMDPGPGRLIRLHPDAYGTDTNTAITQLQVVDVTRSHLQDAQVVMRLLNYLMGMSDNMMGSVQMGGRKTATEARQAAAFGGNRQKTIAEFFSAQGFGPLATKVVQNTQQYYDVEKQFRIAGNLMQQARSFVNVKPDDILGFFDYVPVDGTTPIDRYAMAALWKEIMMQMSSVPSLLMEYDLGKIFAHVAHLSGVKNLQQFKLNVVADDQLKQQMQLGNVVALGKGGAPSGRPTVVSDGGTTVRPTGPAPTPGVGATS